MVKPAEAPKDWKDLLDPRWKGKKIGLPVEAFQWYGGMVTYLGDKAGRDFMKALAAQDPQTQQGYTNTSNLLVAGEFPVAITRAHRIEDARSKGAPVDWSAEANPIVISIHPVGISEKATHPAAARLFYNYPHLSRGTKPFYRRRFYQFPRWRQSAFPEIDPRQYQAPGAAGSKSQRAHPNLDQRAPANLPYPGARRLTGENYKLQIPNSKSSGI